LIHGGLLTNHAWDEQVPVFAQRYRVIRYDVRGHGLSTMPPAPYSNHRDLYDLLRFLQIDQGYVLGHSMGGRIALNLALAYPEMVDALILVGAGVDGYPFSDAVDKRHEEMRAAHQRGDVDAATEIFLHLWVDGPRRTPEDVGPAVRWRTREMAMHNLMLPPARGIPEPLEPAAASRLNEIHCPTLVIVGDQDVPDILSIADLLEHGIAGSRTAVIPGAGHMVSLEQPEAFSRVVLDFLSGL
jgi:pimeloyl-ACP methyl ester carboxylesterase